MQRCEKHLDFHLLFPFLAIVVGLCFRNYASIFDFEHIPNASLISHRKAQSWTFRQSLSSSRGLKGFGTIVNSNTYCPSRSLRSFTETKMAKYARSWRFRGAGVGGNRVALSCGHGSE
jgi:hypothetical protein